MEIWVDHERCHGHGVCDGAAPDFFVFDDSGYNISPRVTVPAEMRDQAQAAEAGCPERAIHLDDPGTDG